MNRVAEMMTKCRHCGKEFRRRHGKFPLFCSANCTNSARTKTDTAARLAAMSRVVASGCVEWSGSLTKSGGYGQLSINGKPRRAHRLAYELAHGPIPRGLFICHTCDNPKCIKPEHLFAGTNRDNMADCRRKGRTLAGDRNPNRKLTSDMVVEIRRLHADGLPLRAIARHFGVTYYTVYAAGVGRRWKHV